MLYTIKCPKCGAEQKNLDLDETEGSFICSECSEEVKVDLDAIKESASDE